MCRAPAATQPHCLLARSCPGAPQAGLRRQAWPPADQGPWSLFRIVAAAHPGRPAAAQGSLAFTARGAVLAARGQLAEARG
ncbi:MAG: hypothetical protein ACLQI7_24320 [Streptosporangiaceae bacterium]